MVKTKRGMEMTLSTIVTIVLLLITVLAIVIFFRDKFTALIESYDVLFAKTDAVVTSLPEDMVG